MKPDQDNLEPEAQARKNIDEMLKLVGWDVNDPRQVVQEMDLDHAFILHRNDLTTCEHDYANLLTLAWSTTPRTPQTSPTNPNPNSGSVTGNGQSPAPPGNSTSSGT